MSQVPSTGGPGMLSYATPGQVFRSSATRAKQSVIVFWIVVASSALQIVGLAMILALGINHMDMEQDPPSYVTPLFIAFALIALLQVLAFIVNVVFFLRWLHLAFTNLKVLGAGELTYSPRWACWGWFIPFANLVIPFRVARELLYASDPAHARPTGAEATASAVPGWLTGWWALWLSSNFVSTLSSNISRRSENPSTLDTSTVLDIVSQLMSIGAALLAMHLIREVEERQRRRMSQTSGLVL